MHEEFITLVTIYSVSMTWTGISLVGVKTRDVFPQLVGAQEHTRTWGWSVP